MANPGGNYPGRQIFVGGLKNGVPAFAYFGSGRSQQSQGRYAALYDMRENAIRIKPVDPKEPFDPFRHYQAVRINPETGLAVISNSQAPQDALVEAYSFMTDKEKAGTSFLRNLLAALGPEYDSRTNSTPRIAGVVFPFEKEFAWHLGVGLTRISGGSVTRHSPVIFNGCLTFAQTYDGNVDYKASDPMDFSEGRSIFHTEAETPEQLADEIYRMSDYMDPKYGELRVWCVAGVRNGNGPSGWEIKRRNRHQVE